MSPSAHRGQPPTDSQNFGLDPVRIFSGQPIVWQWTCPTGFWQSSWHFGSWLHMPGHIWWNGLQPPEHSRPGPSQVPGTDSQGEPAPEDVWPQCFLRGAFGCLDFEGKTWATLPKVVFCLGIHVRPRRTYHAWGQACTPGPNVKPHHGILWEQPPFVPAGKTNWKRVSSHSLGWAHLYRTPFLSSKLLHSYWYWLTFGGSVVLVWPFPSILSLSLAITRLRTGSTSWAWCQSSKVIQVTCLLSWIASKTCRSQV